MKAQSLVPALNNVKHRIAQKRNSKACPNFNKQHQDSNWWCSVYDARNTPTELPSDANTQFFVLSWYWVYNPLERNLSQNTKFSEGPGCLLVLLLLLGQSTVVIVEPLLVQLLLILIVLVILHFTLSMTFPNEPQGPSIWEWYLSISGMAPPTPLLGKVLSMFHEGI